MKTVYEDYEVVKWGCQADWKFCEHDPGFSNENPIKTRYLLDQKYVCSTSPGRTSCHS